MIYSIMLCFMPEIFLKKNKYIGKIVLFFVFLFNNYCRKPFSDTTFDIYLFKIISKKV